MTYIENNERQLTKAEAKLPQGKCAVFRLFFNLFILSCLFLYIPKSNAQNINFEDKINVFLQSEINHYLAKIKSKKRKQKIDLFIPKGSERLTCNNLLISRSRNNNPPAGRVSLSVKCKSPAWRFRASAKVSLWVDLVVAKTDLNRGEVLNENDLEYKATDISNHLHSTETNIASLVGMAVKRNIDKGDVISRRYLENKYLVNKDDHVLLQIKTSSFSANVMAQALQDGQLGEIINVKNLTSDKIVQGKVIAKNVVQTVIY